MLGLKTALNRKGKTVPFNPMKAFEASSAASLFILHLGVGPGAVVDILERRKISCFCQHSNPGSPCPYSHCT